MKRLLLLLVALLALTSCSSIPRDPDDTLARIDADHVLRVGVSHAPPLVDLAGGAPQGQEVALAEAFAASRGATVEWTPGGEEQLVALLEEGRLDLVIGGVTKKTPWSSKAAVTRPWGKAPDPMGKEQDRVFLAPLGENALVVALERFFDEHQKEAGR